MVEFLLLMSSFFVRPGLLENEDTLDPAVMYVGLMLRKPGCRVFMFGGDPFSFLLYVGLFLGL